jgi:hypothetical protein
MSFLAALYLCVVAISKLHGVVRAGLADDMATMLLIGGAQFIVVGVIGLYINIISPTDYIARLMAAGDEDATTFARTLLSHSAS